GGGKGKAKSDSKRGGGSAGKRLDFLFQEMNREANTLGSKAGSMDVTRAAMDLKLLIEQMREQAQNIECRGTFRRTACISSRCEKVPRLPDSNRAASGIW